MADLNVDSFANAAGTGAPDFPQGVKVAGNALPNSGALSNRNKIINGAMQVSQRGSVNVTPGGGVPEFDS